MSKLTIIFYCFILLNIVYCSYSSIKDIPKSKSGFSIFDIAITNKNVKPLFYIDLNDDK